MLKKFPNVRDHAQLSVQFVTQLIQNLEVDINSNSKQTSKNNFCNSIIKYKWNTSNKEFRKCDKIKHDIQIKTEKKKQIEHYFDAVDQQLQLAMKKKMLELFSDDCNNIVPYNSQK